MLVGATNQTNDCVGSKFPSSKFRAPEADRIIRNAAGRIDKEWNARGRTCIVSLQDRRTAFGRRAVDDKLEQTTSLTGLLPTSRTTGICFGATESRYCKCYARGGSWVHRLSRGEELDHEYISKIWRKIKVDRKTRNAGNKMLKAAETETFGIEFLESLTGQYLQEKHWYEVLEVSDQNVCTSHLFWSR